MFRNESLVKEFENSLTEFNQGNTNVFSLFHQLLNCGWNIQQIFDAYQEFAEHYSCNDNFGNYSKIVMEQFEIQGIEVPVSVE